MGAILASLGNLGVKIIWIGAVFLMIVAGIAFLPDGASYPFPATVTTAIVSMYSWLYSLNALVPVSEAATVFSLTVLIEITVGIVWRLVMWVIKIITGGGE